MELIRAYREIEARLEKLDFGALFRGFSRFPFILYNDTQACAGGENFEKPAEFLGNTSIRYNGEHTAIWQLGDGDPDFDVLASKIVHEMLHAFQNASGEKRWADERAALVKYRYDALHISARLEEAACMRRCLEGEDPEAFRRLLSLRRARMERFPYEYDYEARIEQIEGTAHYVENAALAQLDAAKAEAGRRSMLDALEDPERYFPIRPAAYLSGAALISCLRRYTDLDTDRFTETPFAAAAAAEAQPCELPACDPRAEACLAAWLEKAKAAADRAVEAGEVVLEAGDRMLIAWNIFDAVLEGRYAVLTAFIGYIEGSKLPESDEQLFAQLKTLNGDFVAELDGDFRLGRVWRRQD